MKNAGNFLRNLFDLGLLQVAVFTTLLEDQGSDPQRHGDRSTGISSVPVYDPQVLDT